MEETQKAGNAKARMRENVDRKMEEDERARKRTKGGEEEKGEVVCDKTNMEDDEALEETRGKRKRGGRCGSGRLRGDRGDDEWRSGRMGRSRGGR